MTAEETVNQLVAAIEKYYDRASNMQDTESFTAEEVLTVFEHLISEKKQILDGLEIYTPLSH